MASITVKNIPDDLYERLKATANVHHRSINSEVINCLESVLRPTKTSVEERLARIRIIRERANRKGLGPDEISQAIRKDRL